MFTQSGARLYYARAVMLPLYDTKRCSISMHKCKNRPNIIFFFQNNLHTFCMLLSVLQVRHKMLCILYSYELIWLLELVDYYWGMILLKFVNDVMVHFLEILLMIYVIFYIFMQSFSKLLLNRLYNFRHENNDVTICQL